MAYYVGLDLGQAADYTALAVVERFDSVESDFRVKPSRYAVRHMQRWPLGTPYTKIVSDVAAILDRPPLPGCHLVLDNTGVGRAVTDLFRQNLSDQSRSANPPKLVPVTITAGFHARQEKGGWHVPKRDLAGILSVLMSQRRFIVADLPERAALLKELRTFKVKVSIATGNETFEHWRERDHDDLVFSVALPCWYAERAARRVSPLRTLRFGSNPKDRKLRLAIIPRDDLPLLLSEDAALLISLNEPGDDVVPPHGLNRCLGTLALPVADIDPAEHQATWSEPVTPYGKPAADLLMLAEQGKRLWAFLLKKRDPAATLWVFVDDGDRRALSVALAVSDALGLARDVTIYRPTDEEWVATKDDQPPNAHVYAVARGGRNMVVG